MAQFGTPVWCVIPKPRVFYHRGEGSGAEHLGSPREILRSAGKTASLRMAAAGREFKLSRYPSSAFIDLLTGQP